MLLTSAVTFMYAHTDTNIHIHMYTHFWCLRLTTSNVEDISKSPGSSAAVGMTTTLLLTLKVIVLLASSAMPQNRFSQVSEWQGGARESVLELVSVREASCKAMLLKRNKGESTELIPLES